MKRIRMAVLALCLIFINVMPVYAQENTTPKVIDDGSAMYIWEEQNLTQKIETMIEKYQIDIVVATETQKSSSTIQNEADLMFDNRGYGLGDTRDGILFLVSVNDREWAISTSGNAIEMFSDYDLSSMGESVASNYFAEGDYAGGFGDFLKQLDQKLDANLNQQQGIGDGTDGNTGSSTDSGAGTTAPYTQNSDSQTTSGSSAGNQAGTEVRETVQEDVEGSRVTVGYVIGAMFIGLVITAVFMGNMKRKMNTVSGQRDAANYQKGNTNAQIRKEDIFLTSSISKRPIEKKEDHNSPPASRTKTTVHRSSNGNRHGGASGKF